MAKMSQNQLVIELKRAIDTARIAHPARGMNPAARRTLRKLIEDNQSNTFAFKVLYNLGRERRDWLLKLVEHETNQPRSAFLPAESPWLDNTRANGPLVGGFQDDAGREEMK